MHLVTPFFELDIEWFWFLALAFTAAVTAVLELRRTGSVFHELDKRIMVLEDSRVTPEDWAALDARCQYAERLVNKMVDEWSSSDDSSDGDAED